MCNDAITLLASGISTLSKLHEELSPKTFSAFAKTDSATLLALAVIDSMAKILATIRKNYRWDYGCLIEKITQNFTNWKSEPACLLILRSYNMLDQEGKLLPIWTAAEDIAQLEISNAVRKVKNQLFPNGRPDGCLELVFGADLSCLHAPVLFARLQLEGHFKAAPNTATQDLVDGNILAAYAKSCMANE